MSSFLVLFLFLDYLLNTLININNDITFNIINTFYTIPALYSSYLILYDDRFWINKIDFNTSFSNNLIILSISYYIFEIIYYIKHWPNQCRLRIAHLLNPLIYLIIYICMYETKRYHFFAATFIISNYISNKCKDIILYNSLYNIFYFIWISYVIKDSIVRNLNNIIE